MDQHNSILQVENITKRFAETVAVNNVSISVTEGDIVCLLGPSGCGKTTLLRLVAGLESADSGQVTFNNQAVTTIPPHKRGFGMMFQGFALFPHLNVFENIAYGLKMQGWNSAEITSQVNAMLDLVDLEGYEQRSIDQLSGGQQQRVALARSLATKPKLLMLDEPLGALDRALREKLMVDLRHIVKQIGVTAIYVTHDQSEAYAVADKIAVMRDGHIEQYATPQQLYTQPSSAFVARFLGFPNILSGTVYSPTLIETPIGALHIAQPTSVPIGSNIDILIRPIALTHPPVTGSGQATTRNKIPAILTTTTFRGRYTELTFTANGHPLTFEVTNPNPWLQATNLILTLDESQVSVL